MSASVFPARAGMSRAEGSAEGHRRRVPRASGDEPGSTAFKNAVVPCSPRERG